MSQQPPPQAPTASPPQRLNRDPRSPWVVDKARIANAVREILSAIGENTERPGLIDTPRRVADAWAEFIEFEAGEMTTFDNEHVSDEMVVVSGMRVYSFCEHHLLPFWCDIAVGYMAQQKILGLSKFARIAHRHAHRLQLQEQLVAQIADEIEQVANTADVAVIGTGEHTCMIARGAKTAGRMTASAIRGRFRDPAMRAEFMMLAQQK